MAKGDILYLDSRCERAVRRGLARYGRVTHAADLDAAIYRMAERDFDFYFVDADVEGAQAFMHHLRHDPQIAPPAGVILLTTNEDEDCEAWKADTFITKSRFEQDAGYVFSHSRRERPEESGIIRIARANGDTASDLSGDGGARPGAPEDRDDELESLLRRKRDTFTEDRATARRGRKGSGGGRPGGDGRVSVAGSGRRRLYLTASALVLLLVACFIVFWGPLSKDSSPRAVRDGSASEAGAKGARKQKAASAPGAVELDRGNGGVAAATAPAPATQQAATTPPVSDAAAPPAATAGDTVRVTEAQGPAPTAPPPQRVNGPPTVSISGPTQVMARQTATYTACISDPDGDAVSTNWGGSSLTRSWSAPGLYAVSVTVTDSSGLSASASISVRVI